jgi:hypothetical protein
MATFAVTKNETVCNVPFLLRKLTCTGGATSVAYTHGESRSPDMAFARVMTEGAACSAVGVVSGSATAVTLDTLVDSASDIEVYLIWFNQASGGQSTITTV